MKAAMREGRAEGEAEGSELRKAIFSRLGMEALRVREEGRK